MRALRWIGAAVIAGGAVILVIGTTLPGPHGHSLAVPFWIAGSLIMVAGTGMAITGEMRRIERKNRAALGGLPGTATIARITPKPGRLKDNPRCLITVSVSIPGRPVYEATAAEAHQRAAAQRYPVGAEFPCLVDPGNPSNVMLIDNGPLASAPDRPGIR